MATKSTKSFAEQVSAARVMLSGLTENQAQLEKRGITTAFVDELESMIQTATTGNSLQEKLKSDLKVATAELDRTLTTLNALYSEARTLVKLEMPSESWLGFGITAKR